MKFSGRISHETLNLLIELIKIYLEARLNKNIVIQSNSQKIIFTEEKGKPGICGLFKSLEYPNTNLQGEVLTFVIDDLFTEKYPEASKDLSKCLTIKNLRIDTTVDHDGFSHD